MSNKRIASAFLAVAVALAVMIAPTFAAETGVATIGFSAGNIYYVPAGISGVEGTLDLNFGTYGISSRNITETYPSLNKAGYVVSNDSGGAGGYQVTLGLSSFDNGLEGATLTIRPDENGLVSGDPGAVNPPIFLSGAESVTLEADGLSTVRVLEGTRLLEDPGHTALGRWGFNFTGDLNVYTSTIQAGASRAVMTWELTIA